MPRIPLSSQVDLITPANAPRAIFAGEEWMGPDHPYILVTDSSIRVMGSLDQGMSIDPDFGTTIRGPVSLVESPENIHIASYWALNPMLLCSFGSSAALNVPTLVPSTPPAVESMTDFASLGF